MHNAADNRLGRERDMQFMVLMRRRTEAFTDAEFAPHLEPEAQAARGLYGEGVIRQLWGRGDVPGACMLVEAASEAEARESLRRLPLVEAGMLEPTVVPLTPYRGFLPR